MSKFHICSTQIGRIIYWTICQQMKVRWNMPTRRVSTSVTVVAHDFHWKSFKFVRSWRKKNTGIISCQTVLYFMLSVISDHDGWRNNDAWVFKKKLHGNLNSCYVWDWSEIDEWRKCVKWKWVSNRANFTKEKNHKKMMMLDVDRWSMLNI